MISLSTSLSVKSLVRLFSGSHIQSLNKVSKIARRHYSVGTPRSETPSIHDSSWKTVFKNLEDWNNQPPLSHMDVKWQQKISLQEKQIARLAKISSNLIRESKTNTANVRHLIEILEKKNNVGK